VKLILAKKIRGRIRRPVRERAASWHSSTTYAEILVMVSGHETLGL